MKSQPDKKRYKRKLNQALKEMEKREAQHKEHIALMLMMKDSEVRELEEKVESFRKRLRDMGDDEMLKYVKGADNGTLVTHVCVQPEAFTIKSICPDEKDFIEREIARKIAEGLVEHGLVRIQTEKNPRSIGLYDGVIVTGRIDVVPWDKITKRMELHYRGDQINASRIENFAGIF